MALVALRGLPSASRTMGERVRLGVGHFAIQYAALVEATEATS